jgi:hypothetical protein
MTLTAVSAEKKAFDKLADLSRNGLTNAGFCRLLALQGEITMGASKFSQCLAGIKEFENAEGLAVNKHLDELIALRDSFAPVPLSFRDPSAIAPLLEQQRKLRGDVPEPKVFSIAIRNGRHFFVKKNQTGDFIFTLAPAMAAAMSRPVADRIAEVLSASGYDGIEVLPNAIRGLSGLHTRFEALMNLPIEDEQGSAISASTEFEAQ